MLQLIIIGLILFIVGVGATIIYDKVKANKAAYLEKMAKLKASTPPSLPKTIPKKSNRTVAPKKKSEYSSSTQQKGVVMTVAELIEAMEKMKK